MRGTATPFLTCGEEIRSDDIGAKPNLQGIDWLEVHTEPDADNQFVLAVHFVRKRAPATAADLTSFIDSLVTHPERVRIEGGQRVRDPRLAPGGLSRVGDELRVRVSQRGDFSTYVLRIVDQRVDPAANEVAFSFKAGCPSRFDCRPLQECPPEPRAEPEIDYMARDYSSFRQALLDYLPTIAPEWTERHEADLGIALVELFAYAGDQLSYHQDAVATEAYLETARRRISVRRHARLVDYSMHDGASARAFVHVTVDEGVAARRFGTLPRGSQFLTRIMKPLRDRRPPHPTVIDPTRPPRELDDARAASGAVFETLEPAELCYRLNELRIYTWDRRECCLPRGTTELHVRGDVAYEPPTRGDRWRLTAGSYLLLEEVRGAPDGLPAAADPRHRQVVRLVAAERATDPLHPGIDLTRLVWHTADALSFPLCLSARDRFGDLYEDAGVARGNMVLADHGQTLEPEWHPDDPLWLSAPTTAPPPRGIEVGGRPYRFRLSEGPLSMRIPMPEDRPGAPTSARQLLAGDPHDARPQAELAVGTTRQNVLRYTPAREILLTGTASTTAVATETDERGRATMRFGDDVSGMAPADESFIGTTYRIGVGRSGMVGAEALAHVIPRAVGSVFDRLTNPLVPPPTADVDITGVRNPAPAWGGIDPEPIGEVKRLAPDAYRAVSKRAVTEPDYAAAAQLLPEVQSAVATFRWTGSWHTVYLTVDPRGTTELSADLRARVLDHVARYTQTGYDLELNAPIYVALELDIKVCADREHFRADVEAAVLRTLSSRALPSGGTGFFHPDRFTFGQPLYLSALYAAIEAVDGVDSATVLRFSRATDADPAPTRPITAQNVDRGLIPAARLEVLRCDNNPSLPENGVLRVFMGGGK